ncbi:unnamed protein product [Nezara viridula]|uniref:Uncharacterized protein n=1 Tax=Nezara viridula TaxID=85310 RepID=A0A9P0HU38_NEZVI|nr:unnamed protein product [Nezara viridula]
MDNRTIVFDKSFIIRSSTLWNSIPLHTRQSKTLPTFKSRLFNHFLSIQSL